MSDPNRLIPFMRNGAILPSIVGVSLTPTAYPTAGNAALVSAGVTAFEVTNPNPFPVWFRAWIGAQTPVQNPTNTGNYVVPGGQKIQSSTRPDWLAAMPDTGSLLAPFYASDGTTPLYDMSKARLIFVFGSGL